MCGNLLVFCVGPLFMCNGMQGGGGHAAGDHSAWKFPPAGCCMLVGASVPHLFLVDIATAPSAAPSAAVPEGDSAEVMPNWMTAWSTVPPERQGAISPHGMMVRQRPVHFLTTLHPWRRGNCLHERWAGGHTPLCPPSKHRVLPPVEVKVHSYRALTHLCVGSCMCCT